jgi:hypothetical protein
MSPASKGLKKILRRKNEVYLWLRAGIKMELDENINPVHGCSELKTGRSDPFLGERVPKVNVSPGTHSKAAKQRR